MVAAHPGAHGQALHDQQSPAVLTRRVIDHVWLARRPAVRDRDPHRRLVADDLHDEPATPPARRMPDRVRGEFAGDAGHVVAFGAVGQRRLQVMSPELGMWLRQQRQSRSWNVAELARRLRQSARASGDTLPGNDCLCTMIRRWEGGGGVSERYLLHYCKASPGRSRAVRPRGPGRHPAGAGCRPGEGWAADFS